MTRSERAPSVAIVALSLAALGGLILMMLTTTVAGQQEQPIELKSFNEILSLAKKLESGLLALRSPSKQELNRRDKLIYQFVKVTKNGHCDGQFEQTLRTATDYKLKAYELVGESRKPRNWFSNALSGAFGPISKMRGIQKSDTYLGELTKRYEAQARTSLLTEQMVDCDLNRFKIKSLHEIMLILQAEVRYLITENRYIINRAIYDQLSEDNFVSPSNFYELAELNGAQKRLMLDYLVRRRDVSKMNIAQAEDHFYSPGQFVIGRLLDSCQLVWQFNERLLENTKENEAVCQRDMGALDPLGSLFNEQFKPDRFEPTTSFCTQLLNAL